MSQRKPEITEVTSTMWLYYHGIFSVRLNQPMRKVSRKMGCFCRESKLVHVRYTSDSSPVASCTIVFVYLNIRGALSKPKAIANWSLCSQLWMLSVMLTAYQHLRTTPCVIQTGSLRANPDTPIVFYLTESCFNLLHTLSLPNFVSCFPYLAFATCLSYCLSQKNCRYRGKYNTCNLTATSLLYICYVQHDSLPELRLVYSHTPIQVLDQVISCYCIHLCILLLYFRISARGWNQTLDLCILW